MSNKVECECVTCGAKWAGPIEDHPPPNACADASFNHYRITVTNAPVAGEVTDDMLRNVYAAGAKSVGHLTPAYLRHTAGLRAVLALRPAVGVQLPPTEYRGAKVITPVFSCTVDHTDDVNALFAFLGTLPNRTAPDLAALLGPVTEKEVGSLMREFLPEEDNEWDLDRLRRAVNAVLRARREKAGVK